ncbi:ROK family transcriptional regulator [Yinghuangia sp. ASG 101]|uniref:ROK family transcriptional regulator n=1 Tax=Yinghuangia sp. ASG 101 TaxID=2896848 RepID=UPI001E573920|nr:ROK family transcriptional regulator [Yinghuangia sp. ASG 101]UGQ12779.1 ROK family transcriptional regulator [Yinghuangia sp. ASG 101]
MTAGDQGIPVETALHQARLRKRRGQLVPPQLQAQQRNWERIFGTVVRVDGPLAKDIAAITGLGSSAVSGVLQRMEDADLITRKPGTGGAKRVGRSAPVRVNSGRHYIAGIEIRRDGLTGLIVDLRGQPVGESQEFAFPVDGEPLDVDTLVDGVRDLVDDLTAKLRAVRDDASAPLLGLGVELGGHIDGRSGEVVYSVNLQWGDKWALPRVPLRRLLRAATRLHTVVDNDANALGTAQRWFGAARNDESFLMVLVSHDGVGSSEFRDGEPHRGATGKAGELGHIIVAPGDEKCRCGKRGCVEAVATAAAILKSLGVAVPSDPQELAARLAEARARAADGDRQAKKAFADAGTLLGRGLATMLTCVDPAKVFVTGPAVTASDSDPGRLVLFNDDYHAAVTRAVDEYTAFTAPEPGFIRLIRDDERWDGPRGAATMVIRDLIAGAVEVASHA